jgi:large subunit ribosomal protein L29
VSTKRFTELKNLSKQELVSKVRETELQLFQARMKQATGQLQDTALLWRLRKDLARMKMLEGQAQAQAEKR